MLIPVLLSHAALFCLVSGQSSFLAAAMLIAIVAWLDRKPVAAGVLIGRDLAPAETGAERIGFRRLSRAQVARLARPARA